MSIANITSPNNNYDLYCNTITESGDLDVTITDQHIYGINGNSLPYVDLTGGITLRLIKKGPICQIIMNSNTGALTLTSPHNRIFIGVTPDVSTTAPTINWPAGLSFSGKCYNSIFGIVNSVDVTDVSTRIPLVLEFPNFGNPPSTCPLFIDGITAQDLGSANSFAIQAFCANLSVSN